ncbi:MAG: hypothetical protein SFV54_10415 [Bryobacteraceae bacterium]|nr:hypothetical protein [Bryobacteraceae bacterium]
MISSDQWQCALARHAAIEQSLASIQQRQQTIFRNVHVLSRMVDVGSRMLAKATLTRERAEGQLSRLDRCHDSTEQRLRDVLLELRAGR